ncbi:MAG: tetratricopeptide repeat protein [Prevotella sp.]|nr:tetratricopeptide repeat protein [Prevotella sp.]
MAFLSEKETKEKELYYYRIAEKYVGCLKKEEQAGLYNNMSIVYSKMGNTQKAETLLLRSLHIYPSAHAYGILAELYTTQNRLQEARELWNKALNTKDKRLRSTFLQPYAAWLHKIGDEDEAWGLAMKIPFVKDSLMLVQQTEMVKENQEVQDRLKRELEHRQKIMVLCFVIVLLIMCAALTYIVLELKMVRQKKVLAEDRNRINELQATIEVLTQKEGENSEKLKRARKQMEKMRENLAQKTALGKKLYEEILEQGGKTSKWFKKDFEAFCEYYRTIDPEFFVMLESTYDRLTPRQVFIKILDHKNYTEEQILEIMCMSEGTLRTNRSRIAARYIPLDDK